MSRSTCSPWYRIVASLVRARPLEFFFNILRWLLVAIPATWTNSWLSYIQSKLALAYRTRLTQAVIGQYLGDDGAGDKMYYKICESPRLTSEIDLMSAPANLDDRIKNPDQLSPVGLCTGPTNRYYPVPQNDHA
jgi:ATP-binding cassette subfamily D (ALD) long-chain fatty acid import protein